MNKNQKDLLLDSGYTEEQVEVLSSVATAAPERRKKVQYADVIAAYDIETSSFYHEGVKTAAIWHHAISVDGVVHRFRESEDFLYFLGDLARECETAHGERHLVVYVQYLAYEMGFISQMFEWASKFVVGDKHHVLRAVTVEGIEFRCSAVLSGMTLEQIGEEVGIDKKVGDLDHTKVRHTLTPITEEEYGYIDNDVLILDAYIRKLLLDDTMASIPLTKTGYTRRSVRKAVMRDTGYAKMLKSMPLTQATYVMASAAFQGGYTHANAAIAGRSLFGLDAWDLASSYPASLVQFMYPMSAFEEVRVDSREELQEVIASCAALIEITFHGLACRYSFPAISSSKCTELRDPVIDNGRVYHATSLRTVITDVDYRTIVANYDIDAITVHKVQIAQYDYLPTPLVTAILDLYAKKTTLKGVVGMEDKYNRYKVDCNGVFGMVATDPVRTEFNLVGQELVEYVPPIDEALADHNESRSRFLYYPWAAWITAYSRNVLLDGLMRLEDAGVLVAYCDTDSKYFKASDAALVIIAAINDEILARMWAAARHHGFSDQQALDYISPKDKDGERHSLGVFERDIDDDRLIEEFKTLGAKRYAKRAWSKKKQAVKFSITVAGLAKKASGYVEDEGGFEKFQKDMAIPAAHSGRLVHAYFDRHAEGMVTDYQKVEAPFSQKGFIHLEASAYKMGISDEYETFMQKFMEDGIYQ